MHNNGGYLEFLFYWNQKKQLQKFEFKNVSNRGKGNFFCRNIAAQSPSLGFHLEHHSFFSLASSFFVPLLIFFQDIFHSASSGSFVSFFVPSPSPPRHL